MQSNRKCVGVQGWIIQEQHFDATPFTGPPLCIPDMESYTKSMTELVERCKKDDHCYLKEHNGTTMATRIDNDKTVHVSYIYKNTE